MGKLKNIIGNKYGRLTVVACVNTNRRFIGIELSEEYYKIAKERIMKAKRDEL